MLNKIMTYVVLGLLTLLVLLVVIIFFKNSTIAALEHSNEELNTKSTVEVSKHEVELFEASQAIEFKKEKELKHEEIPSSVGVHTINFND